MSAFSNFTLPPPSKKNYMLYEKFNIYRNGSYGTHFTKKSIVKYYLKIENVLVKFDNNLVICNANIRDFADISISNSPPPPISATISISDTPPPSKMLTYFMDGP